MRVMEIVLLGKPWARSPAGATDMTALYWKNPFNDVGNRVDHPQVGTAVDNP